MPHTRRRRFSMQNDMEVRDVSKPHHSNVTPQKKHSILDILDIDNEMRADYFTWLNSDVEMPKNFIRQVLWTDEEKLTKTANFRNLLAESLHRRVSLAVSPKNETKPNPEVKLVSQSNQTVKSKPVRNSSKSVSPSPVLTESDSVVTVKKQSYTSLHKNVSTNSNKLSYYNSSMAEELTEMLLNEASVAAKKQQEKDERRRDRTPRNKSSRQHRIKVRSPKRYTSHEPVRLINQGTENIFCHAKSSTGTDPIVSPIDVKVNTAVNYYYNEEEDRQSNQSNEDICRICHGGESLNSEQGQLISACACRGTVGRVHVKCLERWLTESGKSRCELCSTRYATKRVHKYGIAKALVMWVLSQNAKQLLVDSLGIMLMSPLAVLAAWLSGRTLAGLMVDNHSHLAPWPLASTFVLACLTLVCYYCWIVSAATRHALGWWIWYRSQYEVRLELQSTEN